jgi:hypothetical protein
MNKGERRASDVFGRRATRVLRGLLSNPGRTWTVRGIAKEANVSLGFTHAVLLTLQQQGYITRDERYRILLVDPMRMLRRWAAYHQYTSVNKFSEYHTFDREVEVFLKRVKKIAEGYALTSLAGAWLVAPYVRPATVDIYVPDVDASSRAAAVLQLRPVEKGGNVRLVIPYDEGVFYKTQTIDRLRVVSDIQLYVDLYNYPARGEEEAEKILPRIEKLWLERSLGGRGV